MCVSVFQCLVGIWLAMKGSSILWQQLGLGAGGNVITLDWLSVLCGCGGSVLFESWLSVLCGYSGISLVKSVHW